VYAYANITIYTIVYLFNINSRKIDEYERSWIEYLNEIYNVCILNRSIKCDTITVVRTTTVCSTWSCNVFTSSCM